MDACQLHLLSTKSMVVKNNDLEQFKQRMKDLHQAWLDEMDRIEKMPSKLLEIEITQKIKYNDNTSNIWISDTRYNGRGLFGFGLFKNWLYERAKRKN